MRPLASRVLVSGLVHVALANRLLSALPAAEWARLEPQLERIALPLGHVLHEHNAPITHLHFPLRGVVSLVLASADGITMEAGVVGNEGAVGTPLLFGTTTTSTKAFVQTPGECLRMTAAAFHAETARDGMLVRMLKRYTQATVTQLSQSVLCHRVHSVEERLARWLLIAHDRVADDEIHLTQEFIAQMLAVRRASVTVVAGVLQRAGLINYVRGRITVLDRAGLEDASCECYGVVRQEFERLLCPAVNGGR